MTSSQTHPEPAGTRRSRGSRAANREAMEQHIRALGRSHLRTHGAAGLSLRAIARELGVVSSAVYRYVPSRDDLLTMLLVEGYADLADAVDTAVAQAGGDDPEARLLAAATTVRRWAVDDPARWALLYGSPVPGYAAPAEQTVVPGTRSSPRCCVNSQTRMHVDWCAMTCRIALRRSRRTCRRFVTSSGLRCPIR